MVGGGVVVGAGGVVVEVGGAAVVVVDDAGGGGGGASRRRRRVRLGGVGHVVSGSTCRRVVSGSTCRAASCRGGVGLVVSGSVVSGSVVSGSDVSGTVVSGSVVSGSEVSGARSPAATSPGDSSGSDCRARRSPAPTGSGSGGPFERRERRKLRRVEFLLLPRLAVGFRGVDQLGRRDGLGRFGGSRRRFRDQHRFGRCRRHRRRGRRQQHLDLRRHLRHRGRCRGDGLGGDRVGLARPAAASLSNWPRRSAAAGCCRCPANHRRSSASRRRSPARSPSPRRPPRSSSASRSTSYRSVLRTPRRPRSTHWREVDLRDGATNHRCCCRSRPEPLRSAARARLDWQIGLSAPDVRRIYRRNAGGCPAVSACGGPTPVRSGSGAPTRGSRRSSSPWPLPGWAPAPGPRRSRRRRIPCRGTGRTSATGAG